MKIVYPITIGMPMSALTKMTVSVAGVEEAFRIVRLYRG